MASAGTGDFEVVETLTRLNCKTLALRARNGKSATATAPGSLLQFPRRNRRSTSTFVVRSLWLRRVAVAPADLPPEFSGQEALCFGQKVVAVCRAGKMKGCAMRCSFPIPVLGSTPRNARVARLLAMLTQRPQAAQEGQVIGMDCHAVVVLVMLAHRFTFVRQGQLQRAIRKTRTPLSSGRKYGLQTSLPSRT